jgi:hypothetical protein
LLISIRQECFSHDPIRIETLALFSQFLGQNLQRLFLGDNPLIHHILNNLGFLFSFRYFNFEQNIETISQELDGVLIANGILVDVEPWFGYIDFGGSQLSLEVAGEYFGVDDCLGVLNFVVQNYFA